MHALVAYGSKMGGTAEIAQAIAEQLATHGLTVEVDDADDVSSGVGFDGIVIGSSLYAGRWRGSCVRLLKQLVREDHQGPVWLFHSGPLTDEEAHTPQDLPRKVADLAARLDTRAVVTFGGVLSDHPPGFIAKKLAESMAGDWRDWIEVRDFADAVAAGIGNR